MKAVFLDRDGVINELVYHREQEIIDSPFTENQFHLIKNIPNAIKQLQSAGYQVIVISNQPGIAKRQMTADTFGKITQKMHRQLAAKGASLDAEYYCLHHPEAKLKKYRLGCDCRKPKPGLILQAAREHTLNLKSSWFIGDNLSDVQAGQTAGSHTILLSKIKCDLCRQMAERNVKPDFIVPDILQATDIILNYKGE
jgi:D-glycero-D-manno-heptose 1,7-bisphosphate phosphatase